jgi:GlpG protein
MRQLATLPSASAAQALADYLLTLKIQTQLMQEPAGWGVWVCDEDRLEEARAEFAQFQQNPDDLRFQAAREASEVRRQQRRLEDEYHRRGARFHRRMHGQPFPLITILLIAASVIVFLLVSMPGRTAFTIAESLFIASFVPGEGPTIRWAGLSQIASGEVWRLVTPAILHFNPWHILFNMMLLYQLGTVIERRRGSWRMAAMVLVIAVESNVLQYYFGDLSWAGREIIARPSPWFCGMSGVVYGLFGYMLVKSYLEPDLGLRLAPSAVLWLLLWFVLCFVPEFQKLIGVRVANMAHAAGLLGGLLLGVAGYAWRRVRGR